MKNPGSRAMYRTWRRDGNEKMITNILDRYHIEYSHGRPGDGYDLLVQIQPMELWEIKDSTQRWSLTKAEQAKKSYCKIHGIPYRVIESMEQAVDAITEGRKK